MTNCCFCSQDKYKRALADTENLRSRSQKMVDDAKLYGKNTFVYLAVKCWTGRKTKKWI